MEEKKTIRQKSLFILPSLFTLANMAFGYYAIIAAMNQKWLVSGAVITIAVLMDGFDGRVARITKTTSEFGLNFDSIVDVISFGVAPALILYLKLRSFEIEQEYIQFGGWLIPFFYVAAGALRLARFNVSSKSDLPNTFFKGLPIPAAAGLISTVLWVYEKHFAGSIVIDDMFRKSMPFLMLVLSYMMISNIRYQSFKKARYIFKKPVLLIIILFIIGLLLVKFTAITFFMIALIYVLSGPVRTIFRISKLVKKDK